MKRCLIATPLKLGARASFLGALVDVMRTAIPGWDLNFVAMQGPAVKIARDALAYYAVSENYDRILFVDEDMGVRVENFARILAHDVPVVGGAYCVKTGGAPRWLYREKAGATQRENGLLECDYVATGFLSISTEALRSIADHFPDRHFAYREDSDDRIAPHFEWFPMEIIGPGSAEERLGRVAAILEWIDGDKIPVGLEAIRGAVEAPQPPGRLLAEDYGFCRLARDAGISMFVDLGMPIIGHWGEIAFPLKAAQSFVNPPYLVPQ